MLVVQEGHMDEVMNSVRMSLDTGFCLSSFDELDSSIPLRNFRFLMLDCTDHVRRMRTHGPGQFAKKRLEQVLGPPGSLKALNIFELAGFLYINHLLSSA